MTTSAAEGSQTAIISTEHTLATITAAGKYTLNVDSVNQVSGDTLFLRIYIKVRSTGASTLAFEACFEGAQTQIVLISDDVDSTNEIRYTLQQTTGTGRVYEWEVMQKTDADNAGITANGNAIAALNDFNPASDTVANVTLVATTTTNTDQRGTDNAATAANLAIVDSNVDAILVDTSTTIPATIADLPTVSEFNARTLLSASYFDPATDTVANVTLVATTTTNTDMVGTDGANTVSPDNAGIAANGAAIGALNDFDPSADTVANVALVATTTTNTDMVGTNGANTVAPDNAGITANGSAIAALNDIAPTDIVSAGPITTLLGAVVNVDLVDVTTLNTDMKGTDGANTTAPDNAGITANGVAIAALNDFDPGTDTIARVTLVDTTTLNADMVGTDGANTIAPDNAGITANGLAIAELHNFDPANDVVARVTLTDTTTTNTDMVGTNGALLAANAPANFSALSINVSGHIARVTLTDTNTDMRGTDEANTTAPDNAGITANGVAIAALNNLSPAQVNAEVLDVITVDLFPEPTSVPASTSSILEKLNWLAVLSRNKITQTDSLQSVRDDADFLDIATAVVSDDGTTTTRDGYT